MTLETITSEVIKKMRNIFNKYDKDDSGYLSEGELQRFFKSMETYFTKSELNEAMYIIDTNNDGKVNFGEFIRFVLEDE
tara:strand:+ start:288 stop:524 length:237 start_codon:yes stop_codon:yes gene_type:complete